MKEFEFKFKDFFDSYQKLPLNEKEFIIMELKKIMSTTTFSSQHAYSVFKSNYYKFSNNYNSIKNKNVLEIGCGNYPIITGLYWLSKEVNSYLGVDTTKNIFTNSFWLEIYKEKIINTTQNYKLHQLLKENDWKTLNDKIMIFNNDFLDLNLKDENYDYIYSGAVFEHLTKPEETIKKTYKLLKKGGIAYHNIDLRPHFGIEHKNSPLSILKHPKEEWDKIKQNQYINRLRKTDWERIFKEEGFQILEIVTSNFPSPITDKEYENLPPEFHKYSKDDLNIQISNFLLKK